MFIALKADSKEHSIGRESKVRHLETVVQELPSDAKQKFFQLHDCKRKKGKDLVSEDGLHSLLAGCDKSCEGIFRTNNFCLGKLSEAEHHGVFSTLSRYPTTFILEVFERKFKYTCCEHLCWTPLIIVSGWITHVCQMLRLLGKANCTWWSWWPPETSGRGRRSPYATSIR